MLGIDEVISETDTADGGGKGFDSCCGLDFSIPGQVAEVADKWGSASMAEVNEGLGRFHEMGLLEAKIDVNPNFDYFDQQSPWSNNCSSCSLAVYERMTGVDGSAMACKENLAPRAQDMERITGMRQVEMTPLQIYEYSRLQGAGFTGICGYDRARDTEGAACDGHWICVYAGDHGVYALDGQTDTVMDFLEYVEQDPGIKYDLSIRR